MTLPAAIRDPIDALMRDNAELHGEVARLGHENEALRTENEALRGENGALRRRGDPVMDPAHQASEGGRPRSLRWAWLALAGHPDLERLQLPGPAGGGGSAGCFQVRKAD